MATEKKFTPAQINKILSNEGFRKPETHKVAYASGGSRIATRTINEKSGDYYFYKDYKGNLYMEFDLLTSDNRRKKIEQTLADNGIYLKDGKVAGRYYFSSTPNQSSRGIGSTKSSSTGK